MAEESLFPSSDLKTGSLFCIGRNYAEHARELQNEVPEEPVVFLKPPGSIIYDGGTILLPPQSSNVHHEVEMTVALQNGGKHIPVEQALSHVAGYGVGIDITARDIQQKAKDNSHPWAVAKGFDTFAPLSAFVPAEDIEDPQNIELRMSVNGEIRQADNTRLMIFPVAHLIHYLSTIFTLRAGDIIFTGTPKGVSPITTGDNIEAVLGDDLASLSVTVE